MSILKIRGIVIKEMEVGESDKRVVVLAKGYGKVLLRAKGARNPKSKFLAGAQLFSYCDFVFFEGKGFKSVNNIDLIESFYNIRKDINILAYCTYIADLVEKTVLEGMVADDILELMLKTFMVVSMADVDIKLAVRIFELKYLKYSGYIGESALCGVCGKKIDDKNIFFGPGNGCCICNNCSGSYDVLLSVGAYKAIKHILNEDIRNLFRFRVSDSVLSELCNLSEKLIKIHIGQEFKTLEFAKSIDI